MIRNYFKTAWRNIVGQRLTSIINIGSLSVAMTAVVVIVIWVQNELSFDNYHPAAERIFLLKNTWQFDKNASWTEENSFFPLANAIEQSIPEAELVTRMIKMRNDESAFSVNGDRFKEDAAINVDSNWFKVFNYSFIAGNAGPFSDNPHSVILTESKAKQLFGSADAVGKHIEIDSTPFSVTGVIKDNRLNSSFQFDVILPFYKKDDQNTDWLYLRCKTFVRLRPNANLKATEKKINAIIKANGKADGSITASFLPLKSMHFENDFSYSAFKHVNNKTVIIFSTLALFLLLAAAINYVNLSVARSSTRLKEMSVRKINGASRWHLFMQVMAESIVTGFLTLAITLLLVYLSFPLLKMFSDTSFVFNPLSPVVLLILSGTFLGIILLTGIYPALLLSSFKPVNLFNGKDVLGLKNSVLRKWLATIQFTLTVFMIIAAIVVYRQMAFIQKQDVAYARAQVFTVRVPASAFPYTGKGSEEREESILATVKQKLLALNQIQTVSRTDISSLVNEHYSISNGIDWDGRPNDFLPEYVSYSVDADIDSIMHFKLATGRWFNQGDISDEKNVVLNETAIKKFGLKEPVIGKRFNEGVIIGVVKDFFYQDMHQKIGPLVIKTNGPRVSNFIVQAKAGQAKDALQSTENLWKEYFPGELFDYSFADEDFAAMYRRDQNTLLFTVIFSGLSILICCMGLLGMTVFVTQKRTKEIGIRKALGASVLSIVRLLFTDFIKIAILAIIIASLIAWWAMNNWLQAYAYRINISWWIFFTGGLLAVVLAMMTIGFHAIKAAIANPVKSLRTE